MFETSAKAVKVVGGDTNYYKEVTTTNLYVEQVIGGKINTLTITNDSATDVVSVSFDGATVETELKAGETVTLHTVSIASVYVKGAAGGDKLRIWGW